jgi:hypothetical protein
MQLNIPQNKPDGYIPLDLKFSDLINFLQEHQPSCPNLQMRCPLYGMPSPSIEIKSQSAAGLNVKIDFSLQSCEALIRFVLAAAEPSH